MEALSNAHDKRLLDSRLSNDSNSVYEHSDCCAIADLTFLPDSSMIDCFVRSEPMITLVTSSAADVRPLHY